MKYNVCYSWQGEKYVAGQWDNKGDAEDQAQALRWDYWQGVRIEPIDSEQELR